MKIYIVTDMEGVSGVIDRENWTRPESRYYEQGKRLLTHEINAAVEGFYKACGDELKEVVVSDGHGPGAIDLLTLDKRAKLLRMRPWRYPGALDESFTGIAYVGQHAKAGTEYAHIAHTGWHGVLDERLNGLAIGEFGEGTFIGAGMGVPVFFGSGDKAFTLEAEALVPGIECVAVKWGTTPGSGDECSFEEYRDRNLGALHLHPKEACDQIRRKAYEAALRLRDDRNSFVIPEFKPPYELIRKYRSIEGRPPYTTRITGETVRDIFTGKEEVIEE